MLGDEVSQYLESVSLKQFTVLEVQGQGYFSLDDSVRGCELQGFVRTKTYIILLFYSAT